MAAGVALVAQHTFYLGRSYGRFLFPCFDYQILSNSADFVWSMEWNLAPVLEALTRLVTFDPLVARWPADSIIAT